MKNSTIENHYKQDSLFHSITDAMSASGLDLDSLTREHFSMVMSFMSWGIWGLHS